MSNEIIIPAELIEKALKQDIAFAKRLNNWINYKQRKPSVEWMIANLVRVLGRKEVAMALINSKK